MQSTKEDIALRECLADKVATLHQLIAQGQPYVWLLRISHTEFEALEEALAASIASHQGGYSHLLTTEFALHLIIYTAEWYKRNYQGTETEATSLVRLTSADRERLWDLSGIDSNIYVYNASENPDKPSHRWHESMQLLGGLAVRNELRRDEDNVFLTRLCRIYHGEEIDLQELGDRGRAVAFQQSIACKHSLYEYVKTILDGNCPFAEEDMQIVHSPYAQLISRIKSADREARRDKFEMEWLVSYAAFYQQMVRQLHIRLKPEAVGGRYRQYIGYDRLRDFWNIENPEAVGRLLFDLRFRYGKKVVREATFKSPVLVFSNTGNEQTGFVCADNVDEITYNHVPTEPFTSVEMVMLVGSHKQVVGFPLDCSCGYMQVYKVAKTATLWSSIRRPQAPTALIFDSRYKVKSNSTEIGTTPLVSVPFRDGNKQSETMSWCPIYDTITICDEHNKDICFFNRSGVYEIAIKRYDDAIQYADKLYVCYRYADADNDEDIDEDDYMEEELPLLFGRDGLEVRHYKKRSDEQWQPYTDYMLEYANGRGYTAWDDKAPQQGKLRLRITLANGQVLTTKVYYVPFSPTDKTAQPVWRDFNKQSIRFGIEKQSDIADNMPQSLYREPECRQVAIGTKAAQALINVYRPWLVTEVYIQGQLVERHANGETITFPLISAPQFSLRMFTAQGFAEQNLCEDASLHYAFSNISIVNASKRLFLQEIKVADFCKDFPFPAVRLYLTRNGVSQDNLYEWDYKAAPKPLERSESPTITSGIVFQSLQDNASPRHYEMAKEIEDDDDGWEFGNDDEEDKISDLGCFKEISKHGAYYFLFKPMREVAAERRMVADILLPLLQERKGALTGKDKADLYRFAYEFHFDWMLLGRTSYIMAIDDAASNDEEKQQLRRWTEAFFLSTPKCYGERELDSLKEFLQEYWTFNKFSTQEPLAIKALSYILGDVDKVLGRNETWEDFLREYDACRYKFAEMSRIHCIMK